MSEKPDATKIEAALKRAAYKALHGTREERSGRFLPRREASSTSTAHRDVSKAADPTKRKD
ncbi:MAG: hypothetical protein K2Y71_03755 [Xanthobacteraceae bacterium]|nr:hypothetical protein [Xanthobacteraceae bacterium]